MICIWRIGYFSFMHSMSMHNLIHQATIDIPRCKVILNGAEIHTINNLQSSLTGALFKAILPFVTQASMALLFTKLSRTFQKFHIVDAGEAMCIIITATDNMSFEYELDIHKKLNITSQDLASFHTITCTIHISSESDHVILSCESAQETDDWGLL